MSILIIGIFALVLLAVVLFVIKNVKSLVFRVIVVIVAIFLATGGTATLRYYIDGGFERLSSAREAVSSLGKDVVMLNGTKLFVKINGIWYDTSELEYTELNLYDVSLKYEGKDIKITDSGIVSAIKVLADLDLIERYGDLK